MMLLMILATISDFLPLREVYIIKKEFYEKNNMHTDFTHNVSDRMLRKEKCWK